LLYINLGSRSGGTTLNISFPTYHLIDELRENFEELRSIPYKYNIKPGE